MKSIAGHFLIASPQLHDGNFLRTVVLVIDHDKAGAFGLVLTRPLGRSLGDVWKLIGSPDCSMKDPLYWGGPVESPLIALHTRPDLAETSVMPGVFLSTHKDKLQTLVASCARPLRICTGYSGWGPGQLDDELKAGGWLIAPATLDLAFSAPDALWDLAIAQVGVEILKPVLRSSPTPADPSAN